MHVVEHTPSPLNFIFHVKCRFSITIICSIQRLFLFEFRCAILGRITQSLACHLHLDASLEAPALNGKGEGAGPLRNLLAELVDAGDLAAGDLGLEVLELVGLLGEGSLGLLADLDGLVNVLGDALKLLLAEAAGGHGGGTDADTVGSEGALVTGDGVLVAGNVDLLKDGLETGTVELVLAEVDEDHVGVGTVGDELVAESLEGDLESLGVGDNLLLVGLEVRGLGLLEGDREGGDGVVVGTTLVTGEDGEVDGVLELVEGLLAGLGVDGADTLAEEDHGTTGTTEGLVGGGGDNVGVLEGSGDDLGGDETGDVSHVDHEVGTDGVGNLAHALVVDETAVGRGTGNEDLGAVEDGVLLEHVVVDDASLLIHAVGHGLEVGGDGRDLALGSLVTMGQVTTVGEVKTHEAATGSHDGLVDLEVGRAATEALDIDTPLVAVEVEGLEGALLAEELDSVNVLVAAVVAGAGETLRVLVAHGGAEGIEDGTGGDVLRGDEDNGLALALDLVLLWRGRGRVSAGHERGKARMARNGQLGENIP